MLNVEMMYNDTVTRLKELSYSQLSAVHSFVVELEDEKLFESPLNIHTEEQLWNHIDHSLAQAKAGIGRDADEVIDDLMKEFTV